MPLVFLILYESQVIFFYIRNISIMINSFEVKFKPHGPSNFCKESLEKSESSKMSIYNREMTHVVYMKCNCEFCTVCSLSQARFFSKCSNQLFEIERWLM